MGYASFADERFAAMARDAYHMWQGFGNSGLIVEIMMEQRSQPGVMGAAVDNFRSGGVKRPPQDMIGVFLQTLPLRGLPVYPFFANCCVGFRALPQDRSSIGSSTVKSSHKGPRQILVSGLLHLLVFARNVFL